MAENTMLEGERYNRQMMLWGKDGQDMLSNARVGIIGLDAFGVYAALCHAALGVGNIVLVDGKMSDGKGLFIDMPVPEGERAKAYPGLIRRINPQVNVEGYCVDLESRMDQEALYGCDVIVDATNSVRSKELAIAYGWEKNTPVLSISGKWGYTKLMLCDPESKDPAYLLPMFEGHAQEDLMACLMCGVLTEEVRKLIFKEADILKNPVRFRLGGDYMFGFPKEDEDIPLPESSVYRKLSAASLGGGAIGSWASLLASRIGLGRYDSYDYDVFKPHNANRQVIAYDGIGKNKAQHTAEKVKAMSRGRTDSEGHDVMIMPGFNTERKYDVVFDFVDNFYTRAVNTAYAISNDVPMVSTASAPYSARAIIQVPGMTTCQDCIYQVYENGRREEMIRRASCAENPNPSVVMSNAVAGALGIISVLSIFEPEKFASPFNGEIMYRSSLPARFGANALESPCDCYGREVPDLKISEEEVKKFVKEHPEAMRNAE